jgi:hypothetical protein
MMSKSIKDYNVVSKIVSVDRDCISEPLALPKNISTQLSFEYDNWLLCRMRCLLCRLLCASQICAHEIPGRIHLQIIICKSTRSIQNTHLPSEAPFARQDNSLHIS